MQRFKDDYLRSRKLKIKTSDAFMLLFDYSYIIIRIILF